MRGHDYINTVTECIDRAWSSQEAEISSVSRLIFETVKAKKNLFVFGCSHAGILAEEVFYRTGGLAIINPIMHPGFMLNTRPITKTSELERVSGIGASLVADNRISAGDLLIIHSVSGRNTVPVEMAIEAKRVGATVVCITNLEYSRAVTSRHPDGKRLFEVSDVVIDNCGTVGDAAIKLDGLEEKIGPTSTAVGTAILNAIVIEAVELMLADGITPPVFMSANIDGGDEHNARIFEEYKDNIFYM